ncbi:MAG: hypothetical protein ACF8QF_13940 [Phycisphaerales bacterium]
MRRTTAFTLTIAGLVALAGAAPTHAQDDLLQGPKARQAGPAGAPADFARAGDDLRDPTPAMRHRLLMAAIRSLERDETLARDGAQRQAIEAQDRLYRAALEAYREANAEAYASLRAERGGDRQAMREGRRDGDGARSGDGPPRDRAGARAGHDEDRPARRGQRAERAPADPEQREQMRAEMRERVQALRALEMHAPSPADIDANIWGLLRAEQKQAVEQRMSRIKEGAADRMRDRAARGRNDAEGERPRRERDAEGRGERRGGAALTEQQRERIRRATEGMSPEERREFIEQLRQRMRERGRGEERPAPPMEEVEVPPPGR